MEVLKNILTNHIAIVSAVFLLLIIFLFVWIITLEIKLKRFGKRSVEFFAGKKVPNLEELLLEQAKNLRILDKDIQELYNISNQINTLAGRGYHKMGMVRFNPFKDVGGDQSFSIALLNGKNNGLVLSSLFTREGARIYAKSILSGVAEKYPLTDEEKEAISQAMESEKSKIKTQEEKMTNEIKK